MLSFYRLLEFGASICAVCCFGVYAIGKTCQECEDVQDCDCNCKEIKCLKLPDNKCEYYTVATCFVPADKKVYVVGGKDVKCDQSALVSVVYNGVNCTKECAGCGNNGAFESKTDPPDEDTCSQGAMVLKPTYVVRRCVKS